MDRFSRLPEGCISEILSLTSPIDSIRSSAVSKGFKSAADSDTIWERFLPHDILDIISTSDSPEVYSNYSKKDLYFALCDSPLLLDGGKMSFSIDKRSGKKCYIVSAREFIISWGDTEWYWKWTSHPDSRFSEVANLLAVCWLDIRGRIETQKLSPGTNYGAYLLFKLAKNFYGLQSASAVMRLVNHESDGEAEDRATTIHFESGDFKYRLGELVGKLPRSRTDGWMEIELGDFYNDQGDDGEVEARLIEIVSLHGKSGLIVEGIEFRPKHIEQIHHAIGGY